MPVVVAYPGMTTMTDHEADYLNTTLPMRSSQVTMRLISSRFINQIRLTINARLRLPMSQSYRYVIAQPTSIKTSLRPPYHD
jgi:hypothetical protein